MITSSDDRPTSAFLAKTKREGIIPECCGLKSDMNLIYS